MFLLIPVITGITETVLKFVIGITLGLVRLFLPFCKSVLSFKKLPHAFSLVAPKWKVGRLLLFTY